MNTKTSYIKKFAFVLAFTFSLGGFLTGGIVVTEAALLDEMHASNGISCDDCHDYAGQRQAVPMIKCLDCHDTKALAEATADAAQTNPHENRHYGTEADCNYCHHQHHKSKNFCTPCHLRFDFEVP